MKQETLKDTAKKFTENLYYKVGDADEFNGEPLAVYDAFIEGAKWQANQNQEAINKLISIIEWYDDESDVRPDAETFMWFKQFKNK